MDIKFHSGKTVLTQTHSTLNISPKQTNKQGTWLFPSIHFLPAFTIDLLTLVIDNLPYCNTLFINQLFVIQ